jgi:hypothetical protein
MIRKKERQEGSVRLLQPRIIVGTLLLVLSLAWVWESVTCGRCFISVYLAPVVIVGNLAMAVWRTISDSRRT